MAKNSEVTGKIALLCNSPTDFLLIKGVREGGVTEHASYYMLIPSGTNDGSFDAFPVTVNKSY